MAIGVVWGKVVVVGGPFGMDENGCIATGSATSNSLVPSYMER